MAAEGMPGLPAAPTTYTLLSTQFKAPEFIAYAGPLSDRTVLDYFAQSPFYDKQCTNQMLRMQNIAAFTTMIGRWSAKEEEEQLKKFVGTEYVVAVAHAPSLFVIHRRERKSETETHVTAAYYVINHAIMQAPDLYTILGNRLTMAMNSLNQSFALARQAQPPLDLRSSVSGGRAWKVYQDVDEDVPNGDGKSTVDAGASTKPGDSSLKRVREVDMQTQPQMEADGGKRARNENGVV